MHITELEIDNFRGIRHLELRPDGRNFVVWGPNGSGKSAVVDAIDFLLTGRISRLIGKGTAGITLTRHGPHIDYSPDEAKVRALIQLAGKETPVEIARCLGDSGTLKCDESISSQIKPIVAVAHQGQHVLTRRDILKYVTAEAGTRAKEIQEILRVSPHFSIDMLREMIPSKDTEIIETVIEAFRKAGLK